MGLLFSFALLFVFWKAQSAHDRRWWTAAGLIGAFGVLTSLANLVATLSPFALLNVAICGYVAFRSAKALGLLR